MKATVRTEAPTPLLPAEQLDHARLSLSGLPKDVPLVVAVTYDDLFETVSYELDPTPNGKVEFTFPKIGSGGVARVGQRVEADGETVIKIIGKPISLDEED